MIRGLWITAVLLIIPLGGFAVVSAQPVPVQVIGNFFIIPGESLGLLRLGITKDQIPKEWGAVARTRGAEIWPFRWEYPESNLGRVDFWVDQAIQIGFCTSNGRAFYAGTVLVREPAQDWGRLNFRVGQMKYPEVVAGRHLNIRTIPDVFRDVYGMPEATLKDFGVVGNSTLLFRNGTVIKVPPIGIIVTGLGTYNALICRGESPKGTYIPFLGHTTQFTKFWKNAHLAEEAREFRGTDPVFITFTLEFPPIVREAGVYAVVERIVTNPRGEVFPQLGYRRPYPLPKGETSLTDRSQINAGRPVEGEFTVQYTVNGSLLSKATFMNRTVTANP